MAGGRHKQARLLSDSATKIGYIRDLLEEILSKLPVDSVIRCKLVAKLWHGYISEPVFARLHFSCSPKTPELILYSCDEDFKANRNLWLMDIQGKTSPYVTLPPRLYQNCCMQLISSFNGLLFFTRSVEEHEGELSIQICNPATREVLVVPRGSPSAVEPSVGVLFDLDENIYKVLRFFCNASESEGEKWKYEIYTPDGGKWAGNFEVVQCPLPNPSFPVFPTHVCVGRRIYWFVWSKKDRGVPIYILSIDMDGNLTRVELPGNDGERLSEDETSEDEEDRFHVLTFLIEYQGCLGLVCVENEETEVFFWSLGDHITSSWSLKWSALLELDIDAINSIVLVGNQLLFIIKSAGDSFFVFYFLDVSTQNWKQYRSPFRPGLWWPVAFRFVESLFLCG